MGTPTDKKDLGYLGEDFQYKLVRTFLTDKEYFRDIFDIVEQNSFTQPQLRQLIGIVKDYFNKYEQIPTLDILSTICKEKYSNPIDIELMVSIIENLKSGDNEEDAVIKEMGLKFFKQQNIVKTANSILNIASKGINLDNCDTYVEMLSEALNKGVHNDWGSNITDDIDDTLSKDYREPIPTGIESLDKSLEGGIGKGELGVIAGPSGFGKTSCTTAMASHAALNGYKVVQIVFEDTIKQIRRKHIARIFTLVARELGYNDIEAKDLSKDEFAELVDKIRKSESCKEKFKALDENLRIFRFPSGEMTAVALGRHIKKVMTSGFKVDLAIIDYFECINNDCFQGTTNDWDKEGKSMRKFEALVGELNIALWIPTQGTKDSLSAELVTIDKMGGSVKKAQIAHIIVSIARSTEDIANNIATVALLKNRAGQSGKVYENVSFNNGTCIINSDNASENSEVGFFKAVEKNVMSDIFKKAKL